MAHLEIEIDSEGHGIIRLDGNDISTNLRRLELEVSAGGYTLVRLHYTRVRVMGSVEVEPTDILAIGRLAPEEPDDQSLGSGGYG